MNRADVQAWLDRYVAAWRANRPEPIEALFTDDAIYRFAPYGERHVAVGGAAIAEAWLADPDDPESWEAGYTPYAVDGERAVATGTSAYRATERGPARTYHNVFLLRFAADGRCSEFTELYMREEET